MAKSSKYRVGCSGSGWGVWEIATGKKVASYGRSRYSALEKWYELEGWKKHAHWYKVNCIDLNFIEMATMNIIATEKAMVAINGNTLRRANVISHRTNNDVIGIMTAQMIDLLKTKLQMGVAHFVYSKKNGEIREAWGTTSTNLMNANIKGSGIPRDLVNCVCYWDCERGGFRSLRFENLIRVF